MSQNILKNAGFEYGVPNDWQTYGIGTGHTHIYPEIGRTDGSSVAIEYPIRETDKLASWIQNVPIDALKKYKLSGYIKTENIIGEGASIRVDWKDDDWKWLSRSEIMLRKNGTIPWTYFEGIVTPDPNAVTGVITLSLKDASGKASFDDVSFSIVETPKLSHPNIYINISEIDAIKEKIKQNQEPWKTAYDKLMSMKIDESYGSMGWAMNLPIQSVVYGPKTCTGNVHDYCGPNTPTGDRSDYFAAIKVGKAVRNLGLAHVLTGENKYADKAIKLINGWCLDSDTYMNPRFTNFQSKIELFVTIPGIFYGADLIWHYSGWNADSRDTFKQWVKKFTDTAYNTICTPTWCQNQECWRLVFLASGAVITGESSKLEYAFDRWKEVIPIMINAKGEMVKELSRETALNYSLYALNALMQVAEVAYHHGTDLYTYELLNDIGLEKALDFHTKYASDPKAPQKWLSDGYTQSGGYDGATNGNAQIYELAHTRISQKVSYKNCINRWGRPMNEIRTMGPITLTHAFGLDIGPDPGPPEPDPGPTPDPEPKPIPPGYKLVWEDDFSKNTIGTNWFQRADPNYSYIKDGNLNLKLDIVDGKVKRGYVKSGSSPDNIIRFGPYGFFEVKAKVSNKIGVDNQCWLGMEGWGTPTGFEIDIFEYMPRRKQYSMNFLAGENIGRNWKGKNVIIDLGTDYHLFQFEWLPDTYIFSLDGKELWRFKDIDPNKKWIANKPGKMSLSLCGSYPDAGCSVQGVEDKIDDLNGLPTDFMIEYVRFYQKE